MFDISMEQTELSSKIINCEVEWPETMQIEGELMVHQDTVLILSGGKAALCIIQEAEVQGIHGVTKEQADRMIEHFKLQCLTPEGEVNKAYRTASSNTLMKKLSTG
ncbi:hypothetical protein [Neptuniibacter sp. QD37_11]|uniref:hypothetical protein n=1 Tax=Neptuniibacter sp. QD37_11 TaxID=3398209 RepID=UPI0039F4B254